MIHTLGRHNAAMQKTENDLSTMQRIHKPSDDPVGSANQMVLRARLGEYDQFERNIDETRDRLNYFHSKMSDTLDIFQRVRELAIQGAHGTFSDFERSESIAREIEEHLLAIIDIANGRDSTGQTLFGGSVIEREPFTPVFSNGATDGRNNGRALTGVVYQGDIIPLNREIERSETINASVPGNHFFWGTNMTISANYDASGFIAQGDQTFTIDGVKIQVSAGDTLRDIVDKINNSPLEVSAEVGAMNDLVLSSDSPHQIWLEDIEGGTVLQELGLVDSSNPKPGNNYHPAAIVSGQSVFDVLIQLRDDLLNGDQLQIGGRDLEAIDMAMENMIRFRSEVDARINRADNHIKRIAWDRAYTQELLAKNESIDEVESIVELKWLETIHSYALKVGAGIVKPTLMDFLR